MLDEAIIHLLEPTIEKIVKERLEKAIEEYNEKVVLSLTEACDLVGVSRPTLINTLLLHQQDVKGFVKFSDGKSHWKILGKPFKEWYAKNFRRLA